jgi:hypothetical protein
MSPSEAACSASSRIRKASATGSKTTFKALRRYRGCPWRIGTIVAAALVLLHFENNRTT